MPSFHYFDYNATTPIAAEVFEAMRPYLTERWGNPSSAYAFGRELKRVVAESRESVARLLGAETDEVVFTSCGTESTNTALRSAMASNPERRHLIMTTVEHSANLECGALLAAAGFQVTYLPVSSEGLIDLGALRAAIQPDTALVSVMWANNETGVVMPIQEIGELCREKGVLFHTDAVQAMGKVSVDVGQVPVDYLSLSGHKIYAPKGIGALYVRRGAPYESLIVGGGQENGRRAGTQNVAYIAGLGRACQLVGKDLEAESSRLSLLRDRMESSAILRLGAKANGAGAPRVPNTTNLSFPGIEAEALLLLLEREGICASSGSACSTGSLEPSHVLTAMGVNRSDALGALRLSLGRDSTAADVEHLLTILPALVERLRGAVPA